ncbi:MAG: hypothetical protein AAGC47_01955 [Bacteroidota bacterium]
MTWCFIVILILFTGCRQDESEMPEDVLVISDFKLQRVEEFATDVSLTPKLTWDAAFGLRSSNAVVDEKIVYEVNIAEFGQSFLTGIVITTEEPFVTVSTPLTPNTEYQWLVTARIVGTNVSEAAEKTFSFTTTAAGLTELSEEMTLLLPQNKANISSTNPEFEWAAYDPSGINSYEYLLAIKEISEVGSWQTHLTEETALELSEPLKPATLYDWRVIALDDQGRSKESETRTFTTTESGTVGESIIAESQIISSSIRNGSGFEWGGCFGHKMISHNDKLYDIGGRANESGQWRFGNDVYESLTGATWTTLRETDDFNTDIFEPSNTHAALSHAGLLYVVSSGAKGIFNSALGTVWTKIETKGTSTDGTLYQPRDEHAVVSLNENLYLMGGYSGSTNHSDVWVSGDDGITWQKVKESDDSAWKGGAVYATVVEGAIYLFETKENNQDTEIGIWKSNNGASWEFLSIAPFEATGEYAVCSYLYGMVVVGSGDDIWWSENGIAWNKIGFDNPNHLKVRRGHSAVEQLGSIYVSYGYGSFTGDAVTDILKFNFNPGG